MLPPSSTTFVSQHFSVPVFEVPAQPNVDTIPEIMLSSSGNTSPFSSEASGQSSPWNVATALSQATASSSTSLASTEAVRDRVPDRTKLEKVCVRLKAQYNQVKEENRRLCEENIQLRQENTQLHQDKFTTRHHLGRVECALDEILNLDSMPEEVSDHVNRIVDIILDMKRSSAY